MEDLELQLADLNNDETPELIVYGTKNKKYLANIYSANSSQEADSTKIEEDKKFKINYFHNTTENTDNWYIVENKQYYEFNYSEKNYKTETDYTKKDFEETKPELNVRTEFDPTAEKEEIKAIFETAKEIYSGKSTETIANSNEEDDVINNGGNYVKYDGNTYYWKLTASSRDTNGIYGNYSDKYAKNDLIKIDKKGNETTLLTDYGLGEIFIANEKLFLTYTGSDGYKTYIYSVDFDGENKKEYGEGEIKFVCGNNVYFEKSNNIEVISEDDEVSEVVKEANLVANADETIYYTKLYDYKTQILTVGTITEGVDDGSKFDIDATTLVNDNYPATIQNCSINSVQVYEDYIYILYGFADGTANITQSAKIIKSEIGSSEFEDLAKDKEIPAATDFYLYKDGENLYVALKGLDDGEKNTTLVNTETGEVSTKEDIPYESAAITYNYTTQDIGWRYSYKRQKTITFRFDTTSNKLEKISEF